jgi:hypothetical protein
MVLTQATTKLASLLWQITNLCGHLGNLIGDTTHSSQIDIPVSSSAQSENKIGRLQHGKLGVQSCCWFLGPHMSIYRRIGWLLCYFLEISQCGLEVVMMMTFDYLPSAPNSSDHSTYEGIHRWSGIIYGRVANIFCTHEEHFMVDIHIFNLQEILFPLHLKSPGNEEYD